MKCSNTVMSKSKKNLNRKVSFLIAFVNKNVGFNLWIFIENMKCYLFYYSLIIEV